MRKTKPAHIHRRCACRQDTASSAEKCGKTAALQGKCPTSDAPEAQTRHRFALTAGPLGGCAETSLKRGVGWVCRSTTTSSSSKRQNPAIARNAGQPGIGASVMEGIKRYDDDARRLRARPLALQYVTMGTTTRPQRYAMKRREKCLLSDRPAKARGLCGNCYRSAYERVYRGTATWDELVKRGLAKPARPGRSVKST